MDFVEVMDIEDGLIHAHRVYWDRRDVDVLINDGIPPGVDGRILWALYPYLPTWGWSSGCLWESSKAVVGTISAGW